MKKLVCLLLCLSVVFSLSVTAFADNGNSKAMYAITLGGTYYIKGDNVNLRSGAGLSYSSGGLLQKNNKVTITNNDEDIYSKSADGYVWYHLHVETGDNANKNGWVAGNYLSATKVPV